MNCVYSTGHGVINKMNAICIHFPIDSSVNSSVISYFFNFIGIFLNLYLKNTEACNFIKKKINFQIVINYFQLKF